jgi:transposase
MTEARRVGQDWREWRRLRAWELKQEDWRQCEIAAALGVTEGAVSQWVRRGREGGVVSLRHRPPPGPSPRLTPEQRAQVPALLARGAESFGFRGDIWTARRVTELIRRQFGVQYHFNHVGNLLRQAGWSPQKPLRRASQRNEAAIEHWRTERWPALKRGRYEKGVRLSG